MTHMAKRMTFALRRIANRGGERIIRFSFSVSLILMMTSSVIFSADHIADKIIKTFCLDCHDGEVKKGGLDLSTLTWPPSTASGLGEWTRVVDRVTSGEMPPAKKSQPSADERQALVHWLDQGLLTADKNLRRDVGRATQRRLTRGEYEYALRDLLALPDLKVQDLLPPDGLRHGIDRIGEALDLSHVHLAQYLAAAERALDAAICAQPTPPPVRKHRMYPGSSFKFRQAVGPGNAVLLKDLKPDPLWPAPGEYRDDTYGQGISNSEKAGVGRSQSAIAVFQPAIEGWRTSTLFAPVHTGTYRLRFSTWSLWWNAGVVEPSKRVETAVLHSGANVLGYFDAPSLAPKEYALSVRLGPGDEVIFDAASLWWRGSQVRQRKGGAAAHVGPAIAMDWFEAEGPLYDSWPPQSHRHLFGELPLKPFDVASGQKPPVHPSVRQTRGYGWPSPHQLSAAETRPILHTVFSSEPLVDAKRLLGNFLPRAFRRPVSDDEVARYVVLVQQRLALMDSFELALRHAYTAALCSPAFLLRSETPGPLTDHALATRLALWLWSSVPDEALMTLADQGKLRDPAMLRAQVERLLADPRSERFITDFLDQWLNLRKIETNDPDAKLYPEFNSYLQNSMLAESRAFMRELITKNLPAINLVESDFLTINQRLAEHYGIPGVVGSAIRRVPLPPTSVRGGVLTQAAVLKVTANGTTTSPVVRGAFVTERILGQTIPAPPPNAGAIDPDTRGATTVREQLAKHRADPSCASCHQKMDPPGLALESFDAIGGWREQYRSVEKGTPVKIKLEDGLGVSYRAGPTVDASGETSEGKAFANFTEFRALVRQQPKQIARAFVTQMVAYATGAEVGYADRKEIERILANAESSQYGLRSLIDVIAQSQLFQEK